MPLLALRRFRSSLSKKYFYALGFKSASHPFYILVVSLISICFLSYPTLCSFYSTSFSTNIDAHLWQHSPHLQSVDAVTSQNNPSFVAKQIRITDTVESTVSKELLAASLSIHQTLTVSNKLREVCATTRRRQCIVHSPLAAWDYDQHAIENDADINITLNRHLHDLSKSTGLSLHPYATMGQVSLDDEGNFVSADSVILTFILKNTTKAQVIWDDILQNTLHQFPELYTSSLSVEPYCLEFKLKLMPADYSPIKLATIVLFNAGLFVLVRAQFSKSTVLKSASGLGITALFLAVACYTTTAGIFYHFFRTTIHSIPLFLQLLVCSAATLEHALFLTGAVVSIDKGIGIKERLGKGLQQVGINMTTTLFGELAVLSTGSALKAPNVKAFCTFTSLALVIAYTLNLTLFIAVLSIDIKRAELADLGNEAFEKRDISNAIPASNFRSSSRSKFKTRRALNAFFLCTVILLLNSLLPEPNPSQTPPALSSSQKQWHKISSQFWEALNPTYMNQNLQIHAPHVIILSPTNNSDSFAIDKQQQQRRVVHQLQSYYDESFAALRKLMKQRSRQSSIFDLFHPYLLLAYSTNIPSVVLLFMLICIVMWMIPLIREKFMLPFLRKAFVRITTCILRMLSSITHIKTDVLIRKVESEYNEDGLHLGAISLQSRFNTLQNQTKVRNVSVETLMGMHTADIRAMHTSGNLMVSIGQQDGKIVLWDMSKGEWIARLDMLKRLGGGMNGWAVAEKNRHHQIPQHIWMSQQQPYKRKDIRHLTHARCIQIDRSQSYIVAGFEYGLICVWNADTLHLVRELNINQNQLYNPALQDRVIRILFVDMDHKATLAPQDDLKPLDKYIISVHRDGKLREWNLKTGDMTQCIHSGHTREITQAQLIPNNQTTDTNTLYFITASKDGTTRCWSRTPAQWTLLYTLNYRSMITSVAAEQLHNGIGVLVTGSNDGAVQVWNLETGTAICTLSQGGTVRKTNSVASAEVGGPLLQFSTVARSTPSDDSNASADSSLVKSDHSDSVSQVVITRIGDPKFENDMCPNCSTVVDNGFIIASCALDGFVHVWRLERTALSEKELGCAQCRRQQPLYNARARPISAAVGNLRSKQRRMHSSNASRFNISGEEPDACRRQQQQQQQHQEQAFSASFMGKLSQEGGHGLVFCDNMILAGCRRRRRRRYIVDDTNDDENNGDWEAWFTSLQYYEPPPVEEDAAMIPVITFDLEQDVDDEEEADSTRQQQQVLGIKEQLLKVFGIRKVRSAVNKPNVVSRKNVKSTAKCNIQLRNIDDGNDSIATEDEDYNHLQQSDYDEVLDALPFANIRCIVPTDGHGLCCDYGNFIKVIIFGNKDELNSST
ncbi:hypothetical protein BD408DRAFT_420929 [Parasitella parasitica]|nr:hypothetical protein BD408DRAFT_420929 [Parasitella parasitica]